VAAASGREAHEPPLPGDWARATGPGPVRAQVEGILPIRRYLGDLDPSGEELLVETIDVVGVEAEPASSCALGHQGAHLTGRGRVVGGRSGTLEEDLLGIAGDPHGQPAHEAEIGVRCDLETEDADVEVERLVLVEDVDRGQSVGGEGHGVDARRPQPADASPKLLGLVQAMTKHPSAWGSGPRRR